MLELSLYFIMIYIMGYGTTGSELVAMLASTTVVGFAMMRQAYQESKR